MNKAEPYTLGLERLAAPGTLLTLSSKPFELTTPFPPSPWRPRTSSKRSLTSSRLRKSMSETRRRILRRRTLITIWPHPRSDSIPQSPPNHNPFSSLCLAKFAIRSTTTSPVPPSIASLSSPTPSPSSPSPSSASLARSDSRHCHCSAQANRSI